MIFCNVSLRKHREESGTSPWAHPSEASSGYTAGPKRSTSGRARPTAHPPGHAAWAAAGFPSAHSSPLRAPVTQPPRSELQPT